MEQSGNSSPKIELENVPAEVKSYIHQTLQELEAFATEDTVIVVVSRDPLRLLKSEDGDTPEAPPAKELKKMYRIAIAMSHEGASLEGEGLNKNIYEAIRLAKDDLLKQLVEIQDEMLSHQDRLAQIKDATSGQQTH